MRRVLAASVLASVGIAISVHLVSGCHSSSEGSLRPAPPPIFVLPPGFVPGPPNDVATPYQTSWISNTFGGAAQDWVPDYIQGISVADDGTVFTNGSWDEMTHNVSAFKDGKFVQSAQAGWYCGFSNRGTEGIAVNSRYVFGVMPRLDHLVLARWNRFAVNVRAALCKPKDPGCVPLAIDPCKGAFGNWLADLGPAPKGDLGSSDVHLGAAANERVVVVTNVHTDTIAVYDTETLQPTTQFRAPAPAQVALDAAGTIWVVLSGNATRPTRIAHFSISGKELEPPLVFAKSPTVENPQGIAIDPKTGHLLVADDGVAQQVLIFDVSKHPPERAGALGTYGGVCAEPEGRVGPDRLLSPRSVGADAQGNVYVASMPSYIRAFAPNGSLLWEVHGLAGVSNAVPYPMTDGRDVYTGLEHVTMDYRKTNGKEWSWAGHTLNRFKDPDDPRLQNTYFPFAIRVLGGRTFLFTVDNYTTTGNVAVFRLDGEIAVPVGFISSMSKGWVDENRVANGQSQNWIWNDVNGDGRFQRSEIEYLPNDKGMNNGWDVDRDGNLWVSRGYNSIREYRLAGLGTNGSPIYTFRALREFPIPPEYAKWDFGKMHIYGIEDLHYVAETDTMYLLGWQTGVTVKPQDWHCLGDYIVRYDHFTTAPTAIWKVAVPGDTPACITSVDVAGDRVFAGHFSTKDVGQSIDVYSTEDGAHLGTLLPGPEVGGKAGWLDIHFAVRALRRSNGEYVVFAEDDGYNKVLVYRGTMNFAK